MTEPTNLPHAQDDASKMVLGDERALWRPVPFLAAVRAGAGPGRGRTLLWNWLTAAAVVVGLGIAQGAFHLHSLTFSFGGVEIDLVVSVSMVLATIILLQLGVAWAMIPAFLASFAAAVASGTPAASAGILALASLPPLLIMALVYRTVPLRVDMRSAFAVCGFAAASLLAAIAGSAASAVSSRFHGLDEWQALMAWEGWWIGGFAQALLLGLPALWLVSGPAERLKQGWRVEAQRRQASGLVISTAVAAGCATLLFFLYLTSILVTARTPLAAISTGAPGPDWLFNLAISHGLLLVAGSGITLWLAATGWSRLLSAEVLSTSEALAHSLNRHKLAIKALDDGLWDWDLDARRVFFSPRWKEMLGYRDEEVGDTISWWMDLVHPDERKQLEAALKAHIDGHTSSLAAEHRLRHKDGSYRRMLMRGLCMRSDSGKAVRMAGLQTDVSEHRESERQLVHDAFHDELTSLPNRALFLDRLSGAIARAQRQRGYLYSVLFLDLDRFKVVNDTLGHPVGDQLLIGISKRLTSCLRPVDTVARLGGDEFAILLDHISSTENATELADRIHQQLSKPFLFDGNEVFTSASIGIASSRTGYSGPEDVLRDADTAMYRAKSMGKARHQVFDTAMHAQTLRMLLLETDLRRAHEREELTLNFQPVYSLANRSVVGFEALLRWIHPKWGAVPQKEFLPLAEETGLIVPIGEWVMGEACSRLAGWRAAFPAAGKLFVSVNLSERQFAHGELANHLQSTLQEQGLDGGALRIEVTETVLQENAATAAKAIDALKAQGVAVDLDNFGTGPSSFNNLRILPLDAVKIDRSYVASMIESEATAEIVRAVIALAANLGLVAVAEGVEYEHQLEILESMGCEWAQGYFFSGPLGGDQVEALLHTL